jgi:hypothetical protein
MQYLHLLVTEVLLSPALPLTQVGGDLTEYIYIGQIDGFASFAAYHLFCLALPSRFLESVIMASKGKRLNLIMKLEIILLV